MFSLKLDYEKEKEEFNLILLQWQSLCNKSQNRIAKRIERKAMKKMFTIMCEEVYNKRDRKADILQLKRVESNMIIAIGYQEDFLYVLFNTRVLYKYSRVPLGIIVDLFNEKVSIGKLFNKTVKRGGYKYEKV